MIFSLMNHPIIIDDLGVRYHDIFPTTPLSPAGARGSARAGLRSRLRQGHEGARGVCFWMVFFACGGFHKWGIPKNGWFIMGL